MNNLQDQGRALYKRGEYQKAIGVFDRAIGRSPSVQLLDNRAACYEKLGELSTALKDAKKAIQLHREDATGYLRAGKVLVKMDKQVVALEIYTHGLKCIKHIGQGYELLRKSHKDLMDKLSPPKSVDPLTVLPRELAEIILEYLTFRQRISACMVTKQWAHFIRSSPNLWTHLDLTGARRKVSSKFISRAINVGKNKLTAATLNNLYDFQKVIEALVKSCPLEDLTLLKCGLLGQHLTDTLSKSKHLKRLTLGKDSDLQPYQLQHLLRAVSEHIESFKCNIRHGGIATIDGATCQNLRVLAFTFSTANGLTSLLANISTRLPALKSLTLTQTGTSHTARSGMHMDFDKCSQLEHLDLSLPFASTSLLTLPSSIVVLRLDPMISGNGDDFFRLMMVGAQPHYFLPKLQELVVELSGVSPFYLNTSILGGRPHEDTISEEPFTYSKLRKFAIRTGPPHIVDQLRHPRLLQLEQLSLARSQECNDEIVWSIVEALPNLRTLDLSETDITGVGVKHALKAAHLEHLIVNNCRKIGIDAIDWARSQGVRVDYRMFDDMSGGRKLRYQ